MGIYNRERQGFLSLTKHLGQNLAIRQICQGLDFRIEWEGVHLRIPIKEYPVSRGNLRGATIPISEELSLRLDCEAWLITRTTRRIGSVVVGEESN